MQRFQLVTDNDTDDDAYLSDDDIRELAAQVPRVKVLMNDPIALMSRAQALLTGTAERLI